MSCNNLTVNVVAEGLMILPAGEKHGHVESATPSTIVYGNTGSYGPDARVSIYQGSERVSLIEVQQNFCFLEAGNVTAKTLSGKAARMKTVEGSYAEGRGGQVIIEGVG